MSAFLTSCLPVSPIVSHCPPNCLPLSPHMCAVLDRLPRSCLPIVFHCLSTLVPVLDGVSALDHIRLQEALSPIVSPHVCLCWMLSPHVTCVGWCVRLPKVFSPLSPSLSPSLSPNLSFFLFPFVVGGLILHFFKQCTVGVGFLKVSALVLDGVSAFPRSCLLYCLPVCLSSCFPLWWVVSFCIFSKQFTVRGS